MRRLWWAVLMVCLWFSSVMAFQAAPLVDDCNRTANPLGSGWLGSFDPDLTTVMQATGTVCTPVSAAGTGSTYWGTLLDADQSVTMTLPDATTVAGEQVALYVRMQQPSAVSNTVDAYRCSWNPFDATVEIRRVNNGTAGTLLAGPLAQATSDGDELGCQIIGSTVSLWQNHLAAGWTLLLSAIDPTYTGQGYVGFSLTTNTIAVDNIGFSRVRTTRLGLHHTAEEVALWQQRTATDAEYTVILANADAWVASPDARWAGQVAATCWTDAVSPPGRTTDSGLTDAAFVYLLTGTASYRTPVLAALLAQTAITGTNFADATRWCTTHDGTQGIGDDIGPWVKRLVYGYSYLRASVSASDRSLIETWFSNVAAWISLATQNNLIKRFPNRLLDDYSGCSTGGFCPGGSIGLTHFGGFDVRSFHNGWFNQAASSMSVVGAVGALMNDATHIASAKRFVKEWLAYGVFPGGIVMDQYRWSQAGNTPQHGYLYELTSTGSIISIADHLARLGDVELYTYSTTGGLHGSAGSPAKTILSVLQHVAGLTNGTVIHYASTTSTADPLLRIDQTGPVLVRVEYVNLAPANVYYRDTAVKTAYTTTIPGSYDTSGCDMLRGEWCNYPRVRFLFGSMEGLHWPYRTPGLYVDNTNSCSGTGTLADPYCSLTIGLNQVAPGETLTIRQGSGVYDEYATTTARQGTVTAPITVEPDTGAAFVLRNCDPGAAEAALEILDSDYWTIQGLTFDGVGCGTAPSRRALHVQGLTRDITGVQVLNNTFRDWRQTTGAADGPEALRLTGCDPALGCGGTFHAIGGKVQGNTFSNIDMTALRLIRTQGTLVDANTISALRCGRQGSGGPAETIGIHYTHSNTTLTLRSNTIKDFTGYLLCPLTSQGVATVAGIWGDVGGGMDSDNVIERNTIHDLDAGKADLANAAGISHSAAGIFLEEQVAGTLVKNNVLYDIGTYGIRHEYHATGGTSHVANEFYHNSLYDMLIPLYFKEGVAIVKNNLVSICRAVCIQNDDDADNTLTIDGNLYHDGGTQTKIGQISPGSVLVFTAWQSACGCDATSKNADPQLAVVP